MHFRIVQLAALLFIVLGLQPAEARYRGTGGGFAGHGSASRGSYRSAHGSYANERRGGHGGYPVRPHFSTGGSSVSSGGVGRYPTRHPPVKVTGRSPYPTLPARSPRPRYPGPEVRPNAKIGGWPPSSPAIRSAPSAGLVSPAAPIPTTRFVPPPPPPSTARFVPPAILHPVGGPRSSFATSRPAAERFVKGEVLILTRRDAPGSLRSVEDRFGLTLVQSAQMSLLGGTLHRYRLRPDVDLASTIAALRGFEVVAAAEPNFQFELEEDPASTVAYDPASAPQAQKPLQYAIEVLHLHEAHALSEGSGVRIAVIDSGLDETNPEVGDRVVDRFDAVGGAFTAHRHGTGMGGAIVAHRSLVGIAPKARLIAIRAFSGASSVADGTGFNILRGLEFAVAHGARVVNMSFAGPQDQLLKVAIDAARRQGVVTVAAAGNGGPLAAPQYPAAEPGVIAVTATDASGTAFVDANRGSYIAVAAPGVQILAPSVGQAIQICSGTSIATAEVSGIVALLLGRSATATPDDIRHILSQSAHPLSVERTAGGAGIVDAVAAMRYMAVR